MDWEKSKGRLLKSTPDEIPRPAPVSVWRSIFIAKAWVDLQVLPYFNFLEAKLFTSMAWHGY